MCLHVTMDIGAFVGNWTLEIKTSSVFPNAEYLLFEANAAHTEKLQAAGDPFVITLLGEAQGETIYYKSAGADWETHSGNSIFLENTNAFQANFSSEVRNVTTVDAVLRERSENEVHWDLIKLDVQGSELAVLKGAASLIERCRPVLITETSLVPYNSGAPSFFDMHIFMESIGYILYNIVEVHYAYFSHRGCCSEHSPLDVLIQSDLLQVDILWIPREKSVHEFPSGRFTSPDLWNCSAIARSPSPVEP